MKAFITHGVTYPFTVVLHHIKPYPISLDKEESHRFRACSHTALVGSC